LFVHVTVPQPAMAVQGQQTRSCALVHDVDSYVPAPQAALHGTQLSPAR
jgi:hypothetical protein